MSQISQSLPANDSNGSIGVHLQFHGVKMYAQLSGMFSVPVACCAAMHAAHSLPSQELIAITVWSLLQLRSRCRPYRMFSADTLFLVLLSPARSQSLCTREFSWCCLPLEHDHHVQTPRHVSCHTFESLPVIDSWTGRTISLRSVLSGLSAAQLFSLATVLLYRLVVSASSTSRVGSFSLWLSRARIDSQEHSRVL